jgi:hypothetical protein
LAAVMALKNLPADHTGCQQGSDAENKHIHSLQPYVFGEVKL